MNKRNAIFDGLFLFRGKFISMCWSSNWLQLDVFHEFPHEGKINKNYIYFFASLRKWLIDKRKPERSADENAELFIIWFARNAHIWVVSSTINYTKFSTLNWVVSCIVERHPSNVPTRFAYHMFDARSICAMSSVPWRDARGCVCP